MAPALHEAERGIDGLRSPHSVWLMRSSAPQVGPHEMPGRRLAPRFSRPGRRTGMSASEGRSSLPGCQLRALGARCGETEAIDQLLNWTSLLVGRLVLGEEGLLAHPSSACQVFIGFRRGQLRSGRDACHATPRPGSAPPALGILRSPSSCSRSSRTRGRPIRKWRSHRSRSSAVQLVDEIIGRDRAVTELSTQGFGEDGMESRLCTG